MDERAGTDPAPAFPNADIADLVRRVQRAEDALRASEMRNRQIQDLLDSVTSAAKVLIATIDHELRYTYFNREHHEELSRLTGKSTVVGMSLVDLLEDQPALRDTALGIWRRALQGETIEQTILFGDPGRHQRWYATRQAPLRDHHGRIIGASEVSMDVTDRVVAERELQVQSAILARVTDGVLLVSARENRIVYCNPAYEAMFGYERGELLGRHPSMLNAADLRSPEEVESAIVAAVRSKGSWQGDIRNVRKDGSGFWTHAAITTHDIAPWGPVRMCIQRDVSVRKDQEAKIDRQRRLLRNITRATDVQLVVVDLGFHIIWANEAYARGKRLRRGDFTGHNYFQLFPDEAMEAAFRRVRGSGEGVFRKDAPSPGGGQSDQAVTYWDWSLVPLRDARDEISGLLLSMRETTPYKRTELALAASEERYRALVEQVSDGIFITDRRGQFQDINGVFASMFGRARDEILGLATSDLVVPEERHRVPGEIARLSEGQVTRTEWRVARKDGTEFVGEVLGRRLPDGRYQGVVRDISERRQAESERLAALAQQRDTLVREVHHRIKNHLHGVMGLLTEQGRARPSIAAPLAEVRSQVEAIALVYGLQAGQRAFQVGLEQLVALLIQGLATATSVDFQAQGAADAHLAEVACVPVALIVNELLTNARKHRDAAAPERPVRVRLVRLRSGARLEVRAGPSRLPAGFDFDARKGLGTGLEIVAMMLPSSGAHLEFRQLADETSAVLWLDERAFRPPSTPVEPTACATEGGDRADGPRT